ncbi:unnamed protein product [Brachionus calyciflorus]|uniref:EamA domain-containing protein n=1 Tax=Brachionus calyciflorus TaxID=104777 RepID=A0A814ADI4_9BILA|nr:unnamed protein product [Brachionus calyciflorus]
MDQNLEKKIVTNHDKNTNDIVKNDLNQVKIKDKILRQKGIFYALSAAFFIALSGAIAKYCTYFNGSEQTAIRYLVQLILMLIIGVYRRENLLGEYGQRKILFFRGVFGTIGLLLITISFKTINPSDTVSLVNCSIIIVSVLSRFILKEKFTICHLVALTMTSIGVVLISQPSFLMKNNELHKEMSREICLKKLMGMCFALIGAFCSATVSILLKKLANKKVHYSIAVIYASYIGLPICSAISLFMLFTGRVKKPDLSGLCLVYHFSLAISSSLAGLFAQIFMNLAYSIEDVSKVSLISSTDLLFSFILQYFFLKINSNLLSVVGALFILVSVFIIMVFKMIDQKYSKKVKSINCEENNYQENLIKCSFFKKILFYKF